MSSSFNEYYVKHSGIADLVKRIGEHAGDDALSLYFPSGLSEQELETISQAVLPERIVRLISDSTTGGIVFLTGSRYLVIPPFPVTEKVVFTGYNPEPLELLLTKEYTVGMVLVHLGSYAIGVCRGEKLISSKVGTGLVHGRTRKGGSSSARFQRRRQNQAREFLERVCVHAREHLEPYRTTLDYIVYGGPAMTVLNLQKECEFLQTFKDRTLPLMEVPQLRQKVLESSVTRLWSSRIIRWNKE